MQNSLVHSLEGYLVAIFADLRFWYGSASDWERDKNRSLHELASRGERMLTIDWPALRKHLDKCLEEGQYSFQSHYLTGRASRKAAVPAFCKDLYLRVFDVEGKLRSDPDPEAVAALRQLFDGWGKLKHPCKEQYIAEEVKNFLDNEKDLRSPTLGWEQDDLFHPEEDNPDNNNRMRWSFIPFGDNTYSYADLFDMEGAIKPLSRRDARTVQTVCDIISSCFGDFHNEKPLERPKHGTGRVSNMKRDHSKYDFSTWPRKLDRVFPYDWYATHDLGVRTFLDQSGA